MAKEHVHALKGLACHKRVAAASSPAAICKQDAALTSTACLSFCSTCEATMCPCSMFSSGLLTAQEIPRKYVAGCLGTLFGVKDKVRGSIVCVCMSHQLSSVLRRLANFFVISSPSPTVCTVCVI